jgi:site-specific recombinase XerD
VSPAVFDSESLPKKEIFNEPTTYMLECHKSITGFLQYKSAEGLAPVTVSGYERDLNLWIEYQGDMNVAKVETHHILSY